MEKVSVIITTHNGSTNVCKAIESVINQTYENIEIIVVDDNGLNTKAQIDTYEAIQDYIQEKRIKYIAHDVNKNGSAARNTGIKNSTGKYIALLDDDDEYFPNKIEKQVDEIRKLPLDWGMVYTSFILNFNGRKTNIRCNTSGDLIYEVLSGKIEICSSSILFRRNILNKIKEFDISFKRHQDWEFIVRTGYFYKIKAIEDICFIKNVERRNSPRTPEKSEEYMLHYIEKMKPYMDKLSSKQRQDIIFSHRLRVGKDYLKSKNIKGYLINIYLSKKPVKAAIYTVRDMINKFKKSV